MRIDSYRTPNFVRFFAVLFLFAPALTAQHPLVDFHPHPGSFALSSPGHSATIFLSPEDALALALLQPFGMDAGVRNIPLA